MRRLTRVLAGLALFALFLAGRATAQEAKSATVTYDIRDFIRKPETIRLAGRPWNSFADQARLRALEPTDKAAMVVDELLSACAKFLPKGERVHPIGIEVVSGSQLVIRATPAAHEQIRALLKALRRLGDINVHVKAHLFEVDETFHSKLKNAPPIDWEEAEQRFLGVVKGKPSEGELLIEALSKQKPVLSGAEVKVDDGGVASLLSRHKVVTFLPKPEQVIERPAGRNAVLEGVSFAAGLRVSPDRRFVRVRLTEKATHVRHVKKVKVLVDNDGKEVDAEIPFVSETAHISEFEAPDGGSVLVPVEDRPREDKKRWVLMIQPRIEIAEEEEAIRLGLIESAVPLVVADVLKNPRLKANRDFFGTPDDKLFVLVDSPTWTWPETLKIDVPGFKRTQPLRTGKRILGIRLDRRESSFVVALVNAGGSENGPALGAGVLRYETRQTEKGLRVELADSIEP